MSKTSKSSTKSDIPPELIQMGKDFTSPFVSPLSGVKNGLTQEQGIATDAIRGNVTNNQYLPTLNAAANTAFLGGNVGGQDFAGLNQVNNWLGGVNNSYQGLARDDIYPLARQKAATMNAAQVGNVADITAKRGKEFMSDYQNPFLKDVVDTSLADYDTGTDRSMAAERARRGAGAAFGTGADIADAIFSADAARGRGALSANLRQNAFNTAAGLGMQDASRFLTADQSNQGTQLARAQQQAQLDQEAASRNQQSQYQNNAVQSNAINQLLQSGLAQTQNINQIGQNTLDWQKFATGNATDAQTLTNMNNTNLLNAGGVPFNQGLDALKVLYSPYGQTQTTNDGGQGFMNVLGNLGAAFALKSDMRVKEDISPIGKLDNGLPVYGFKYKSGGPYQIGLMAQDVEKIHPEAVVEIDGIKYVNYKLAVS